MIISIEGNIGSGKSTFIRYLRSVFDEKEIAIVPEPVDEWESIQDRDGKSMLEYFYSDQERNAFSFQMMAYISRLACIRKAVDNNPKAKILVTERCLETDRNVFAKMLHSQGKIRDVDYEIYTKWFDCFSSEYNPTHHIYIQASPKICAGRITKRSRDGEENIPIGYLEDCGAAHENWLMKKHNVYVCDGSLTPKEGHPLWEKIISSFLEEEKKPNTRHPPFLNLNYFV